MAGKYVPLAKRLRALRDSEWRATFAEIESVLRARLPASARKHAAWWSNGGHGHASAWMDAGFETSELDIPRQTVVFRRADAPRLQAQADRTPRRDAKSSGKNPKRSVEAPRAAPGATVLKLGGIDFRRVSRIEPAVGSDGQPLEYMPQKDYAKAHEKPLNKHGHGPFCRFAIPDLPAVPGLYAVTVDRRLAYIGIAKKSLRQRWGASGYAEIQPVNCYRGGQPTNCKMNHAILRATQKRQTVELWIRQNDAPRPLESYLIRELDPPWNDQR